MTVTDDNALQSDCVSSSLFPECSAHKAVRSLLVTVPLFLNSRTLISKVIIFRITISGVNTQLQLLYLKNNANCLVFDVLICINKITNR